MTSPIGTDFLSVQDLLDIADVAVPGYRLADPGLLASAVARPVASYAGGDAYPGYGTRAAALLHSLLNNHAFVDGNKRIGWVASLTFLAMNGQYVRAGEDEAYDLVIAVADGSQNDVVKIGNALRFMR